MKNKKADQKASREKRKDARRTATNLDRVQPTLLEKPTILIVCKGQNTEPSYFNKFRLSSAIIKSVGEGYNTISLVNRTIQLAQQNNFDQVWCVFDKDDFNDLDFNNAIEIATANNFGVAYSNQAFEYWIILHFDDHQGGGMLRNSYHHKINDLLKPYNLTYDGKKSKIITEEIFELLDGVDEKTKLERKQLAINRAKRNLHQFNTTNPAKKESSTTVFKLVEELLKYI